MARKESAIVYNWILDYYCFAAWEDFINNHKISAPLLDCVQGLLNTDVNDDNSSIDRSDKKLFLTVLSRIADGEDIYMRYDDSELSPLEDLFPHFLSLVYFQLDDDLVEVGKKVSEVIKYEAVMAYLRQKQFKLAQKCFSKFFSGEEELKVEKVKNLRLCIKEKKNPEHITYKDFIDCMIAYLKKIVDCFETPLLIVAAEHLLKSHSEMKSEKRVTRKAAEKCLQENITDSNSNNSSNISKDKQKLRNLWQQNVREMFGSPSPEKTSTWMMSSPIQPKSPAISNQSKTSPVCSKTLASPQPGTSMVSTTVTQSPVKLHTPTMSNPVKVGLFKSPCSSVLKSGVVRSANKSGLSDKFASPELQYKKNQGRLNRHEPCPNDSSFRDDISEVSSGHRKRKWTEDEMVEFFNAVKSFGVGNWAEMRDFLNTSRTSVMLKDKWRTMVKNGDAARLESASVKKKKKQ